MLDNDNSTDSSTDSSTDPAGPPVKSVPPKRVRVSALAKDLGIPASSWSP